jgi:hypothetical protein
VQRLLIDENLSPSLIGQANDKGFVCSHVNHLGLMGRKDWELKATILDGDWTFITNNGVDFRGPAKHPGSQGVYADVSLHAGLVCVDASGGLNMESQRRLFDLVLANIEDEGVLTNQVLQVTLSVDGSVELIRYAMPG